MTQPELPVDPPVKTETSVNQEAVAAEVGCVAYHRQREDEDMKDHANIQKCVIGDLGMVFTGENAPKIVAALNGYLARFAAPIRVENAYRCLNCDCDLSGLLGTFQWGVVNGEGTCSNCDWPCRAHHYPKDSDGDDIFDGALQVILQYHPTQVTAGPKEKIGK